ncbi:MAG: hypothetical protein M3387_14695, partial [Actinomycetota bacterium]|nr:hypothetical protein [Actinomycetota bacterium]
FDPANAITDYGDPLDTPFGEHIVTDVVRRIVPAGRITRDLDVRDMGRVFPLVTIPEWIAGRVFYDLLGRVVAYLFAPLLVGYAAYRVIAYLLAFTYDVPESFSFWESYRTLPGLQVLFGEIAWDALLLVTVFVLFFFAIRRTATRVISSLASRIPGERPAASRTTSSVVEARNLLQTDAHPPMRRDMRGREIDVFVSGHTHAPSLSEVRRDNADAAIVVNSGCWLRQLQPIPAHFGGPPVFASRFVQTHVRVFLGNPGVRVELWEHPKPARVSLRAAERIAILGRLPAQPAEDARPRVRTSGELRGAE